MSDKEVEPLIPLMPAELLFVATSTMAYFLSEKTDYPVHNVESVINAYTVARDKHLKASGYSDDEIEVFTETAIDALVSWLEDRKRSGEDVGGDFDRWAQEILGGDGE